MHDLRLPAGPCDDALLWLHSFSPSAKDCNWSHFPHTAGCPFAASPTVAFTCLTWVITPISLDGRMAGFGRRLLLSGWLQRDRSYRVNFVQKSLWPCFPTNNVVKKITFFAELLSKFSSNLWCHKQHWPLSQVSDNTAIPLNILRKSHSESGNRAANKDLALKNKQEWETWKKANMKVG